jgi:hypothetical protein
MRFGRKGPVSRCPHLPDVLDKNCDTERDATGLERRLRPCDLGQAYDNGRTLDPRPAPEGPLAGRNAAAIAGATKQQRRSPAIGVTASKTTVTGLLLFEPSVPGQEKVPLDLGGTPEQVAICSVRWSQTGRELAVD